MDEEIQLFLSIARILNLTKTGKALGLSKSQVSRRLSKLENTLNVQLVQRSPQKVSLTEAGLQFYAYAIQIEATWHAALEELGKEEDEIQGLIRLTAPIGFGMKVIMPKLQQFAKLYPKVNLNIDLSSSLRNAIVDDYDIVIRNAKTLRDSDFKARKIVDYQMQTYAAPAYLATTKTPTKPKDLIKHPCISIVSGSNSNNKTRWHYFDKNKKSHSIEVSSRFCVSNYEVQMQLALAGLGIVQLPDIFANDAAKQGQLVPLLKSYRTPQASLWLLHPYQYSVPKRMRLLIEFLCQ
jgi:DNA-binding transcriptional LysR family regulator